MEEFEAAPKVTAAADPIEAVWINRAEEVGTAAIADGVILTSRPPAKMPLINLLLCDVVGRCGRLPRRSRRRFFQP